MKNIANQQVTVVKIKSDKYGRSVGKVLLEGEDVNIKQVSRGLAWLCTDYIKEVAAEDRELYRAAESAANDAHKGLWQDELPVATWSYRRSK